MANSSSNLFNNLAKEIHKIKCKYGHDNKKCGTCGIKYKDSKFCFEYTNFKNNLIEEKCLCCNKNYQKTFHENLKKRFGNKINLLISWLTNLTKISINLFYCCQKVFTLINL